MRGLVSAFAKLVQRLVRPQHRDMFKRQMARGESVGAGLKITEWQGIAKINRAVAAFKHSHVVPVNVLFFVFFLCFFLLSNSSR